MRNSLATLLILVALGGCAPFGRDFFGPANNPQACDNPVFLSVSQQEYERVFDGVADVVGDYFRIEREDPVRVVGNTLLEGRIDTFPATGATLLEPWEHNSANEYERLESTLQSIRRYAIVRVMPEPAGGFKVEVAVYKELENLRQPEKSTSGQATFRNDVSEKRLVNPDETATVHLGWIPQGRDGALEQRIINQILYRFTLDGSPIPVK
jgi:hypothetical protein